MTTKTTSPIIFILALFASQAYVNLSNAKVHADRPLTPANELFTPIPEYVLNHLN